MVEYLKAKLIKALVNHFGEDDRRIEHALRVTAWAEMIAEAEGGDRNVVLAVGLLHDVGIKEAEQRHGSSSAKLQEQYGPAIVRRMLEEIGLPEQTLTECADIVGKHHTPHGVPGRNFAILWDADMLVNLRDEISETGRERLESIIEKSFRTSTGKALAQRELLARQAS